MTGVDAAAGVVGVPKIEDDLGGARQARVSDQNCAVALRTDDIPFG